MNKHQKRFITKPACNAEKRIRDMLENVETLAQTIGHFNNDSSIEIVTIDSPHDDSEAVQHIGSRPGEI